MQIEPSPFLHRGERRAEYRTGARVARDANDRIRGAYLLESLRYRWWVRQGTLHERIIQPLGDFGRRSAPWLALLVGAYILRMTWWWL